MHSGWVTSSFIRPHSSGSWAHVANRRIISLLVREKIGWFISGLYRRMWVLWEWKRCLQSSMGWLLLWWNLAHRFCFAQLLDRSEQARPVLVWDVPVIAGSETCKNKKHKPLLKLANERCFLWVTWDTNCQFVDSEVLSSWSRSVDDLGQIHSIESLYQHLGGKSGLIGKSLDINHINCRLSIAFWLSICVPTGFGGNSLHHFDILKNWPSPSLVGEESRNHKLATSMS